MLLLLVPSSIWEGITNLQVQGLCRLHISHEYNIEFSVFSFLCVTWIPIQDVQGPLFKICNGYVVWH